MNLRSHQAHRLAALSIVATLALASHAPGQTTRPASTLPTATNPTATNPKTTPAAAALPGLVVVVDTTETPDLNEAGRAAQTVAFDWYPRIVALLPSEGFRPSTFVRIDFRHRGEGVAHTVDDRITCFGDWWRKRPDDGAGVVVHELAHVAQAYKGGDHPGWLVEGIADYVRFYHFEPASRRPRPDARRASHDDSYQTSAHFLNWAQSTYDPQLVQALNAACRQGVYAPALWRERTGKTVDELGAEWKRTLAGN